ELRYPHGGENVTHPVVKSRLQEGEGTIRLHGAVIPQAADPVGQIVVIGGDHAALAGGDPFSRVETEAAHGSKCANLTPEIGGSDRAGGILNDRNAPSVAQRDDLGHGG